MGDENLEPDAGIRKAEQLMSSNLSGSQLDLFMHGEGDPFAPGHVKPNQYEHDTENSQNDTELNKIFLESEKNRSSHKPNAKYGRNNSDNKENGEPDTETSTL